MRYLALLILFTLEAPAMDDHRASRPQGVDPVQEGEKRGDDVTDTEKSAICASDDYPPLELEYLDTEQGVNKFRTATGDIVDLTVLFDDFVEFRFNLNPNSGYKIHLTYDPMSGLSFLAESEGKTGMVIDGSMILPTRYLYQCIERLPENESAYQCLTSFRERVSLTTSSYLALSGELMTSQEKANLSKALQLYDEFARLKLEFYKSRDDQKPFITGPFRFYKEIARNVKVGQRKIEFLTGIFVELQDRFDDKWSSGTTVDLNTCH